MYLELSDSGPRLSRSTAIGDSESNERKKRSVSSSLNGNGFKIGRGDKDSTWFLKSRISKRIRSSWNFCNRSENGPLKLNERFIKEKIMPQSGAKRMNYAQLDPILIQPKIL
ncbi:hypothetical protein LEP1GSC058_2547 [Leptospira fainei serovar Hurstbridge str. BUT 6]|uniref:Uncharacterized protein n=1 Tax=Leptospira fainei serovar Hurstbridge str. BUT 6 TaxID=1193011 RepID=S3UZ04_9LEPT|nr:hypothetical protein LEP1GSC058_2547 [Leptospira fainei serovar Hurstbridge str. BUT 6]